MGESPQLRGFYYGSGFNSGGMMMGGGAGRQLAHLALRGYPEYDIFNCDVKLDVFLSKQLIYILNYIDISLRNSAFSFSV